MIRREGEELLKLKDNVGMRTRKNGARKYRDVHLHVWVVLQTLVHPLGKATVYV